MKGKRFRLRSPSLGIMSSDGHRIPVTIPINAIIQIADEPFNGNRLVDIVWEGNILMMWTQDVRQRCEEAESERA